MKKIILINPRGFCAGVRRAIEIVELALLKFKAPVFVYHEIVHNKHVIKDLESKGAVFIDDFEKCPKDRPLIFSAHGVSKEIINKTNDLNVIDATCPLVSKVHREAIKLSNLGYQIIMIGHKNHPEVIGTMGQIEGMILVENVNGVEKLDDLNKVAVITQTTLSIDDTKEIADAINKKFENIILKNDICYATTNRQEAIKKIASKIDRLIVVGSKNSSNSNRLVETAKKYGCADSILVDDYSEIDLNWTYDAKTIAITAGASAPEFLVTKIIDHLSSHYPIEIEEFIDTVETAEFLIPKELR